MFIGYLFAVLAMLSIGILGILSKLADNKGCTPLNTTLVLFGGSTVFMGLWVSLVQGQSVKSSADCQRYRAVFWRAGGSGFLDILIRTAIREDHHQLDFHESFRSGAGHVVHVIYHEKLDC